MQSSDRDAKTCGRREGGPDGVGGRGVKGRRQSVCRCVAPVGLLRLRQNPKKKWKFGACKKKVEVGRGYQGL